MVNGSLKLLKENSEIRRNFKEIVGQDAESGMPHDGQAQEIVFSSKLYLRMIEMSLVMHLTHNICLTSSMVNI